MLGQVSSFGLNPLQSQLKPTTKSVLAPQLDRSVVTPQANLSAAPLDPQSSVLEAISKVIKVLALIASSGASGGYSPRSLEPGPGLPSAGQPSSQSPRLNNTLNAIANDPEGAKLLAAAKANGYTIEVGDPTVAAGGALDKGGINCTHCKAALDAGQQINGVTLPDQKKIIINPDAPDFEKTVVHELVHAATEGDGNSQQEEGIADVIGFRVANRITGQLPTASAQSIFNSKIANYPDLMGSNNIRNTLASLGINAGI